MLVNNLPYIVLVVLINCSGLFGQSSDSSSYRNLLLVDRLYQTNLVPNPDFHSYQTCPEKYTIVPKSYFVDDWTMPTGGTPDYFNVCSNQAGVPGNWVGHINPRKGYGYVGLIAGRYTDNNGNVSEVREYIQAELKEPLKANQTYYVRFFVSLAGYSKYALDGMAASFSDTLIDVTNYIKALPLPEHIYNPSGNFLQKKSQWVPVEGIYTANGTEQYIVIGNFRSDAATKEKNTNTRSDLNCSYYLVDDVLVSEVTPQFVAQYNQSIENESNVQVVKNEMEITSPDFNAILFDFDKTMVNGTYINTLKKLADFMLSYPDVKVSLVGHTDAVGDSEYNLNLSEKRAKEVAKVLASKDIKLERLQIKGVGEAEPVNSNESEEERALNRRVEIRIH